MRFLADESCDFGVVRALREAGHDVVAVCELRPQAEDQEVIDIALEQKRMVLTEDKDFGRLVYAHGKPNCGVIFMRYPAPARRELAKDIVRLIQYHGKAVFSRFVVAQPGRIRFGRD